MSLDLYGFIKDKCVDEPVLEDVIREYFNPRNEFKKHYPSNRVIAYEGICDRLFNGLYFEKIRIDERSQNRYSSMINNIFHIEQRISFNLNKWNASIENELFLIDFFLFLNKRINSEILVIYIDIEYCLISNGNIIWSDEALRNTHQLPDKTGWKVKPTEKAT